MSYELLVIGGGRWGQVYLKEIIRLRSYFDLRITVCTDYNFEYLHGEFGCTSIRIIKRESLEFLREIYDLAIICTSEEFHHSVLMDALKMNINKILVEKPFLQNLAEYKKLKEDIHCRSNHIYVSCPYIFSDIVERYPRDQDNVVRIRSEWHEMYHNAHGYKQDNSVYMTATSHLLPIMFLLTKSNYDQYELIKKSDKKLQILSNNKLLEINCTRTDRPLSSKSITIETHCETEVIDLEDKRHKVVGIESTIKRKFSPLQSQIISIVMDKNKRITKLIDYSQYNKISNLLTLR